MSLLTMDMSSYEVQQNDSVATEYDDEVLCSGWIPSLALQQSPSFENKASIPESLTNVDIRNFLSRMYVWTR